MSADRPKTLVDQPAIDPEIKPSKLLNRQYSGAMRLYMLAYIAETKGKRDRANRLYNLYVDAVCDFKGVDEVRSGSDTTET